MCYFISSISLVARDNSTFASCRLWLLVADPGAWRKFAPVDRQCLEFNFEYSVKYEERLSDFEVGPPAWLCDFARLPSKILQSASRPTSQFPDSGSEVVFGRSIWIRDRFGFRTGDGSLMEHSVAIEISEVSYFRASTHHSDGAYIFLKLRRKDRVD